MNSTLDLDLELKAVNVSQRLIEGYASVTNVEDQGGDIIERGAFLEALGGRSPRDIPVFIGHQHGSLPVGMPLEIREDDYGLFTRTKIHTTSDGDDLLATARERHAAGSPLGMSIGYSVKSHAYVGGKRRIKALSLGEYSYVASPMNRAAVVTAVKRLGGMSAYDYYADELDELREWLAEFKRKHPELDY